MKPIRLECEGTATVRRGDDGVLRIDATSRRALLHAQGWAHGFDRALPLLFGRILAQGRASELLAATDELLAIDGWFRRQGWYRDADAEAGKLDDAARPLAEAYVAGVNAALSRGLPWELRLAGCRRLEPWSLADSVVLTRMMGWLGLQESQGQAERLLVDLVRAGISRERLDEIFPGLLGELDEELVRSLRPGTPVVPPSLFGVAGVPRFVASNNWVVAPARSATGRALLASDPHLEVDRLPPVFQELVLRWDGGAAAGASLPGIPGIVIGRNRRVAWGATYAFSDGVDSWVEECRDGAFLRDGRWVPFDRRTETILRKGKPPATLEVYENAHGILDGDPSMAGRWLATEWTGRRGTGARSLEASLSLLDAGSTGEALEQLGRIETPWFWVAADVAGDIGFQMSGLVPRRRPGANGFVPLPGWDPENDWRGVLSPAELPRTMNPEEGVFFTANQNLDRFATVPCATLSMSTDRADRIAERLSAREKLSTGDLREIQLDLFSREADRWIAHFGRWLESDPAGRELLRWDRCYDVDSRGAPLFEAFRRAVLSEVFRSMGEEALDHLFDETAVLADFSGNFEQVALRGNSAWFEGRTPEEICRAALARLASREVPARWGDRNRLVQKHLLLGGRLPRWLGLDRGPIEIPGGRATIRQGQCFRAAGRATSFVATFRMVADLGEPGIETALAGGASDRPFSRWYSDGVASWLSGALKTIRLED